jgi:hypothetical protein
MLDVVPDTRNITDKISLAFRLSYNVLCKSSRGNTGDCALKHFRCKALVLHGEESPNFAEYRAD